MLGKTIRIYLADGTSTGIRHAEVVNWTGQAVACPRSRMSELAGWEEAKRPGVYVLFGFDEESGAPLAYVGEAEVVFDRLQNHVANKDFWNEVIFFTNKDENLTKAHIKYLESRFLELASVANRYKLENGNIPKQPSLPRGDRDSMEEFLEQARGLLGVLGHRILEPLTGQRPRPVTVVPRQVDTEPGEAGNTDLGGTELFLDVSGIQARAIYSDEGIVILTGSLAAKEVRDSLSPGYRKLRDSLIREGVLSDHGSTLVFARDQLFSNASPAAAICVGYSINGRRSWLDKSGRSIAELESAVAKQ